ncbi:MAG: type IV secretory system conjugative DNA transfer family protein [Candidatus Marsarchaeota archaeon]|jgi:DNA helicase HerA-like ATPase|nr:type IV secretory system conjugative DNA transfer family protein [Candidatus Marsarchaeota archaeon]
MDMQLSSTSEASRLFCLPIVDEQTLESIEESARDGIFIGISKTYMRPFFLNFGLLMNPHVFITGITGSGKTYLARSMMLKLQALLDCIVIVIDFTGEYAKFAEALSFGGYTADMLAGVLDEGLPRIVHISLKGLKEDERIDSAVSALDVVVRKMRERDVGSGRRVFVILDEAWKLIEKSRPLKTIIREGRKYGVGMIIASQMISDIDAPFLSNMATVFVFRTQDREALGSLQQNYGLKDSHMSAIQNLDVGSCFVIQLNKANIRYAFGIRKVAGVEIAPFMRIMVGDGMSVEVSLQDFERMVKDLCNGRAGEVLARIRPEGRVRLNALIWELVSNGARRKAVLASLREIGIRDEDIADAFSSVMAEMADDYGIR